MFKLLNCTEHTRLPWESLQVCSLSSNILTLKGEQQFITEAHPIWLSDLPYSTWTINLHVPLL